MKNHSKLNKMSKNIMLIAGLLSAACAFAKPQIIYDSGLTKSVKPYMGTVKTPNKKAIRRALRKKTMRPDFKNFSRLPVYTPALTPGKVNSKKINHPHLKRPFFIVGSDRLSHHWLIENKHQLKKLQAVGIAVNVQTEQQLTALKHSAGGLNISPIKGGKMARQLKLSHYPALISGGLIEQ